MKAKQFLLPLLILVLIGFSACQKRSVLKEEIDELRKELPLTISDQVYWTSIELDDDNLVMTFLVDNLSYSMIADGDNQDLMKNGMLYTFQNLGEDFDKLNQILIDENISLVAKFISQESNQSTSVTITPEELALIAEGNMEDINPLDYVRDQIKIANSQMPMDTGEGMIITEITLDNKYLVYNVLLDEDFFTIYDIEENKREFKNSIKENLDYNDPSVRALISACKKANLGIAYRFVGSYTGSSNTIAIESYEL